MEQTLKNPEQNTELIIAGAGPAGRCVALYAVRAGITPLILYKDGGALEKAKEIENYYGFPAPISGKQLYENGLVQHRHCLFLPAGRAFIHRIQRRVSGSHCFS